MSSPAADPTLAFVLVDLTTDITPTSMRPTPQFDAMIAAWLAQIEKDYAPHHGAPCVSFRVAAAVERLPNEIAINFRDSIPEAPGALAYHSVTNGVPDIEIGVDLFSTLTTGVESVSSGVSHELLELLGDIGANQWADLDDGSGKTRAHEMCDPVQNTGYDGAGGVSVSNFVLPSYFIPGAAAPYDFLGVMPSPTDLSHGYEIQATAPTDAAQVDGEEATPPTTPTGARPEAARRLAVLAGADKLTELQKRRKAGRYSRTYRRGVRL